MTARMRPLSLYLDTSVIGGYFDPEFMADTRALWRLRDLGRFRFVSSQVVFEEIGAAPDKVRELMRGTFHRDDVLVRTEEAEALAVAYMEKKIVPDAYTDDARHVAICSIAKLDYIVSWNFKHLANLRRESGFNAVNLLQGYPPVRIVAPTALIYGQEETV